MIEIVQNNNNYESTVYEGKCPKCKSILRFTRSDSNCYVTNTDYEDEEELYGIVKANITCPCCGKTSILIHTKKVGKTIIYLRDNIPTGHYILTSTSSNNKQERI